LHTIKNAKKKFFYFVDESGDPTFFDADGNYMVGKEGCSPILILGFIKTEKPKVLRRALALLREEIKVDDYLKSIPSVKKSSISFHAKDDCPEVREKVFKLLKTLPFKCQFIVARKRLDAFTKNEARYFSFLEEKISFICDIYDFDKYPHNFYNKNNPLKICKISLSGARR
jgi:hypothetical protein